jgi:hypothetical protein
MPPVGNARLDHAAKVKIQTMLRALYNHWLAQGVPDRLAATIKSNSGSRAASRSGHQPSTDRGIY